MTRGSNFRRQCVKRAGVEPLGFLTRRISLAGRFVITPRAFTIYGLSRMLAVGCGVKVKGWLLLAAEMD